MGTVADSEIAMPYIPQADRTRFAAIDSMPPPTNAGELNYIITRVLHRYLDRNGRRYQQMNDAVGALDCAKHEFQRRTMDPYEDQKLAENGDVL